MWLFIFFLFVIYFFSKSIEKINPSKDPANSMSLLKGFQAIVFMLDSLRCISLNVHLLSFKRLYKFKWPDSVEAANVFSDRGFHSSEIMLEEFLEDKKADTKI